LLGINPNSGTVGSRFATVRFMTIHFYDPYQVGPSTPPNLWCIIVATQASFLCLVRLCVHVFLLFLF